MRAVLALAALVAMTGCAEQSRVLVTFGFTADAIAIPAQATRFTWVVLDRDGAQVGGDALDGLDAMTPPSVREGFFTFTLEPYDGNAGATYEVVGTLYDAAGTRLAAQRGRGGYASGEATELRLLFDDACSGAVCDYDGVAAETCQGGECYEPCVIPTPMDPAEERRTPSVTCQATPCPDGDPATCVPHGGGQGVRRCVDGVYAIEHCDTACVAATCS